MRVYEPCWYASFTYVNSGDVIMRYLSIFRGRGLASKVDSFLGTPFDSKVGAPRNGKERSVLFQVRVHQHVQDGYGSNAN